MNMRSNCVDFRKSIDVQKHSGIFPTDSQKLGFSHGTQFHRCDVRHMLYTEASILIKFYTMHSLSLSKWHKIAITTGDIT